VCGCKCVTIFSSIAEQDAFGLLLVFFLFRVAFSTLDAQPISASIAEPDAFVSFLVVSFLLPSQIHQLVYQIHELPSP
jgi:ammonia channel protein AmtB